MKTKKTLLVIILSLLLVSCSDDSDPASPTVAIAGTYSGSSTQGKPVTITISGINGEAYVTSFDFEFAYSSGGGTASGSWSETNSEGIVKVDNNSFEISFGSETDNKLEGTINNNTINGGFKYYVSATVSTSAEFTLNKE